MRFNLSPLLYEVRSDRQVEDGTDGDHRAMRKAQGLLALDVEFLVGEVGGPGVFHLAEDKADVEHGLLQASARDHQDQGHYAADQGGDEEDPEPPLPPYEGANGSHQFDVAGSHGAQGVEYRVNREAYQQPHHREEESGLWRTD